MLSPIDDAPISAGTTSAPDKQICASGNGANTVVYTVPTGRKFTGWASNGNGTSSSYWAQLEAGGVVVRHYSGFSTSPSSNGPPDSPVLTLLAGTVVKVGNGQTVYVFGVESDG